MSLALSPMSSTPSSGVISSGEKSRKGRPPRIGQKQQQASLDHSNNKMNNQYQLIKDVHPGDVGWTVKVTIAEKSPARTAKKSPKKYQNIILMDSQKPVVVAKHLKVSSFNGVSLSTKANSSFFINGPFDIVEDFKIWAKKNTETLNNIVSEKCYLHLTPSKISLPNKSKYTDIKNIQGLQKTQKNFWIKGKAFVKVLNQPFWYMSCDNCNKVSGANYGDIYQCVYCKYPNSKAAPRAKVYLQLIDSTGYINATAIGEPAESFLLCNAKTLMDHSVLNPDSNIIDIIHLATEEEKTFYIKAIQQNQEATEFKYELLFILGSDSTVTTGNQQSKDKGKSPMLEDEQSQQMDSKLVTPPPAKRSLFQTPETPLPTKKKTEIDTDKDKNKKEV
ncbi:replication protein A 70 kDa DNA-binding subunit D-like [Forsythia ovata]|uniref:Replication protein A 70 kDa DNA-binding subunit D-like n=1 Tax=Forsythia ovata TaxID=205694 RepID=A0ABD1TA10_9LAMI